MTTFDHESASRPDRPRLRLPQFASDRGGIGGVYLGTICHGGTLAEVYADFDGTGQLVALHPVDVGSCEEAPADAGTPAPQ